MQNRSCSAALVKAEGESGSFSFAGTASDLIKAICHVMIAERIEV